MLVLRDLIRLSAQHRTLYCYLLLWIFLLIAGMYKYVSSDMGNGIFTAKSFYNSKRLLADISDERHQKIKYQEKYCNNIPNILQSEEGGFIEGWTLQGDFFLFIVIKNKIHSTIAVLDCRSSTSDSSRGSRFTQSCTRH